MNDRDDTKKIMAELRAANSAQGEAMAFVHIGGYSLSLGFSKIEWLLQNDRWKHCGFETIEGFAQSLKIDSSIQAAAEKRKKLAVLFVNAGLSQRKTATALNTSKTTIHRDTGPNGPPAAGNANESNDAKFVGGPNGPPALPSGEQAAAIINRRERAAERIARRQEEHAKRIEQGCTVDDLEALIAAGEKFPVIYSDPPWPWETWAPSGKLRTCAENHYNTSALDEIARLPVAALAADDCALFLWCTGPHIAAGNHVDVIRAWGFKPSTFGFTWIKTLAAATSITLDGEGLFTGNGYATRSNPEVCLLAFNKGHAPLRLAADVDQVIFAPRPNGRHSAKPEEIRRRIQRLYCGPYLELYGRMPDGHRPPPGWTVWGNEIDRSDFHLPPAEQGDEE
jgi:N6-adenosine-specific RNA methylase IME4